MTSQAEKTKPNVSKSYSLFEFYYRVGIFCNAIPFLYDTETRRFRFQPGFKFQLWVLMTYIGILLETLLVIKVLVETKLDTNFPASEWSLIMFVFLSWSCVSGLHTNILVRKTEIPSYMNQLIGLREHFEEAKLPPTGDYSVVRVCLYSMTANFTVQSLMVAVEGTKPTYLYSLVPEEYRNSTTNWIWYVYAYWRVLTNFSVAIFVIFTGFMHVQTFDQIFRYRSLEKRSIEDSLRIYRMLQIFADRFNHNFSTMCIPYVTMFACGNIILGLYGTLRFYDKLDPAAYLNLPLMGGMMLSFCITYYPRMARVKEASKEEYKNMLNESVKFSATVRKLMHLQRMGQRQQFFAFHHPTSKVAKLAAKLKLRKTRPEPFVTLDDGDGELKEEMDQLLMDYERYKQVLCIVRACPPIGVNMGSFYQIKQSTVLTLFNFIACNTISALLTWK